MAYTEKEYKELSIKELTKMASRYEGDYAEIYKMCKKDSRIY